MRPAATRCDAVRRDTIVGVTTILVPDPSLVLLVGAAGAGKTTFAARHFAPGEVLSSDAYRALVSGDEADQSVSRVAFRILHRELERRLADRLLTVVDATNVAPGNRRQLIRRARAAGVPVVALVLAPPGPWIGVGEGTGVAPCTFEGLLKYSEIAPFCSSVVASSSHISRKNAIIAVAKSANATFHEPPW